MNSWKLHLEKQALNAVPAAAPCWGSLVREPFTTAWQQNKELQTDQVRSFFAIYACLTLISGDISKMAAEVKRVDSDGVWKTVYNGIHKLLKKPNRYQNSVQFRQWWITSKLASGNTYVLKQRGKGGNIEAMYVIDCSKVTPLVADDGSVYYELNTDNLNGVTEARLVVPASEMIHDRYQPQFHPLIGVSPIYAAALAGAMGKKIQQDSHRFFANGASPGGILTAPGSISKTTADTLKAEWDKNYSGENAGRVAVVGDGLKFEAMRAKSTDSQLVEQLRLSADIVASCFHVPTYKISMNTAPNKPQEANLAYYSDCLQVLIEEMEACLDDGLEVPDGMMIELDTDDLLRMDKAAFIDMLAKAVGGSVMTPNAAMLELNQSPVTGGDTIYMQQQNYSLEALSKRDAQDDPFGNKQKEPAQQVISEPAQTLEETKKLQSELFALKALQSVREALYD